MGVRVCAIFPEGGIKKLPTSTKMVSGEEKEYMERTEISWAQRSDQTNKHLHQSDVAFP